MEKCERYKGTDGRVPEEPLADFEFANLVLAQLDESEPPSGMASRIHRCLTPKKQPWSRMLRQKIQEAMTRPALRGALACACLLLFFSGGVLIGRLDVQPAASLNAQIPSVAGVGTFEDASASLMVGRGLVMADKADQALPFLERAVRLDPGKAETHFWLGVGYAGASRPNLEQQSYQRALLLDPDHIESRLYLAHSLMEQKQWEQALGQYDQVLVRDPGHLEALYAKGLAAQMLGDEQTSREVWKSYLHQSRQGKWALRAVHHLNRLGDFSWRTHQVGLKRMIVPEIRFQGRQPVPESVYELQALAGMLQQSPQLALHVVAYASGDTALARDRALMLRTLILSLAPGVDSRRVKASWFDVPDLVRGGGKTVELEQSVRFIGQLEDLTQPTEGKV